MEVVEGRSVGKERKTDLVALALKSGRCRHDVPRTSSGEGVAAADFVALLSRSNLTCTPSTSS
jgi:hypothetical protein